MSVYEMSRLFFGLKENKPATEAYLANPEAALAEFDLTDAERTALLAVDLYNIYRMGVHPLLLRPFGQANGIDGPDYMNAIRGESPEKE